MIGRFCAIGTGALFVMNGANHATDGLTTHGRLPLVPNEETLAALQEDLSQAKRYGSFQELMDDIIAEPDDED